MPFRVLVIAAGLLATPWIGGVAQSTPSKGARTPAQRLLQLENGWTTALVKRDTAYFRRNLHPDYVYSDERGTFTKEQVIAEQIGGTDTVTSAENQNMHAHVHGSAAAVTGVLIVRGRGKNGPFEHRYRYTDSFVRENGRWLMFASQDYEIPSH
jgi:ketosteroid isomerase-like protein